MEILTTVVVPNYNGISYLENCLASLYAGTRIPKVIVVDNGSSDGSEHIAKRKVSLCTPDTPFGKYRFLSCSERRYSGGGYGICIFAE